MRTTYKVYDNKALYFVTSSIIGKIPIFTDISYCEIIINTLKYSIINKGLKLYAFVIMPNHFHFIVSANDVTSFMKEFKSYTARLILKKTVEDNNQLLLKQFSSFKRNYKTTSKHQVWQEGFQPKQIISKTMLDQKIKYIHNNAVKAGLVEYPELWKYSSASNYINDTGIIEIHKIY